MPATHCGRTDRSVGNGGNDGGAIPPQTTISAVSGTSVKLSANAVSGGAVSLLFTAPNSTGDPDPIIDPSHSTRAGYQKIARAITLC